MPKPKECICEPTKPLHENPCSCICHIKGDGKEEPTSQWNVPDNVLVELLDQQPVD